LKQQKAPEIAEIFVGHWADISPLRRNQVISLLLNRDEWAKMFLQGLDKEAIAPSEVGLAEREKLRSSRNQSVSALAAKLFPENANSARSDVVAAYEPAIKLPGNPGRGAEVFSKNCAACHRLNETGNDVGPDLAALRLKDRAYWIKNILDPNAVIEPRFVPYNIELKDDRSLSGIIRADSANSLTVVSANGASETISKNQIKEIRASKLSLMPEGFETGIAIEQMADLLAYLQTNQTRKQLAGNEPKVIAPGPSGTLLLKAAAAEIYGNAITLESEFNNLGMWQGQDDYAAWSVQAPKSQTYDVFLDFACAESSSGNTFEIASAGSALRSEVAATGPDWSRYRQAKVGQLKMEAGIQRVQFRAAGTLKGALLDLRAVALVPKGQKPDWGKTTMPEATAEAVLRDPASVARFILDPRQTTESREMAVNSNPQFAGALIGEMTRDLNPAEEYSRIPWIWRVALACGKRNDLGQIKAVLQASLPKQNEPLRDWQAVVLGGGIINGISQRGESPLDRIKEALDGNSELESKWTRALELAAAMCSDEKISAGTRYDALRLAGMLPWDKAEPILTRYLADPNAELQMGAVSALADQSGRESAALLNSALPKL
jgi:putative heme-binding domain-containing protein